MTALPAGKSSKKLPTSVNSLFDLFVDILGDNDDGRHIMSNSKTSLFGCRLTNKTGRKLVPTVSVGMPPQTLCVQFDERDAER